MSPSTLQCDVLVIGAGIAGVSIAERVSREARRRNKRIKVLVVDRASELASGASSGLQGWFHSGSLYTRLGSDESYLNCVKSHEVLERDYAHASDFPHHSNCNINADSDCDHAWFGHPIRFVIDQSDNAEWTQQVQEMTGRLQDLGASIDPSLQFDNGQYSTLLTPDRSLRTQAIVSDLAQSAARNGTSFLMGHSFLASQSVTPSKSVTLMNTHGSQRLVHAKHTLLTTGYDIPTPSHIELSRRSGIIVSATPALDAPNIVRIARDPRDNISHIAHPASRACDTGFSAIGDSNSLPGHPSNGECVLAAREIIKKVKSIFGEHVFDGRQVAWHMARKVEVAMNNSDARTFGPLLYHIAPNCLAVIPSKFSLFPLLADIACAKLEQEGLFQDLDQSVTHYPDSTVPPVAPLLSQRVLGLGQIQSPTQSVRDFDQPCAATTIKVTSFS